LPDRETFHQVDVLIEGLSSLSLKRFQCLLKACTRVKVKRLFCFFADRHQHETYAQHQPIRTTAERSLLRADRGSQLNAD
jgi:hypothetical protein